MSMVLEIVETTSEVNTAIDTHRPLLGWLPHMVFVKLHAGRRSVLLNVRNITALGTPIW